MKPWNRFLLPALLMFVSPGVLLAQTNDPGIGTWVLNLTKSSFKSGSAPQSETRTYESTPDGVRVTIHAVGSDGTATTETGTYRLDGKPYAFKGTPSIDAVEVTRVNARETRGINLRHGKIVGRLTRTVSKDGRTLTVRRTLRTAAGKTLQDVRVYDRQ